MYEIIESKLEPLTERLTAEFQQTDEHRVKQKHERIIADHMVAQNKFCSKYNVDKDDYCRCYDVFGVLRNKEYLAKIKTDHKVRKRSYQEYRKSTYERYTSGNYSIPSAGNYSEDEKAILKQFYRSLCKNYHPDLNPGKDTTAEMQLLNKLKDIWRV